MQGTKLTGAYICYVYCKVYYLINDISLYTATNNDKDSSSNDVIRGLAMFIQLNYWLE